MKKRKLFMPNQSSFRNLHGFRAAPATPPVSQLRQLPQIWTRLQYSREVMVERAFVIGCIQLRIVHHTPHPGLLRVHHLLIERILLELSDKAVPSLDLGIKYALRSADDI